MKTLVIGLGNPVLTDDGVGWHVAERLRKTLDGRDDVHVELACVGGLALMEEMVGFDRAIVVDATRSDATPGTVRRFGPGELSTQHSASGHDVNLATALKLGRRLGAALPDDGDIVLIGVEAADVETFGESCTPPVGAAIPTAESEVLAAIDARDAYHFAAARGD
ncbi:MAG: hydrogenase maturation protease [Acidobacteriota bacterium]|nr:hydrogenase maturation protease [Acidobacteriota bacterium]